MHVLTRPVALSTGLPQLMELDRKLRQPARTMIKSPQAAPAANSPTSKAEAPEKKDGMPPIKGDGGPQLSIDKVLSYEQAYEKIKEATGVSDIHELIDMFLTAEDANFRKFNFVNTQNSEIENMEQQISDTKSNIEKYKGQGVTTDTQRKKQLRGLEDQLKMTLNKTDESEKKYQMATKIINQLKQGIHSLFTRYNPAMRGYFFSYSSVFSFLSFLRLHSTPRACGSRVLRYLVFGSERDMEGWRAMNEPSTFLPSLVPLQTLVLATCQYCA